jgi:protein-S-isoprenylcysteine O-methyltransferase Ste14
MKSKKLIGAWVISLFMLSWGTVHFFNAIETRDTTRIIMNGIGLFIFLIILLILLVARIKARREDETNSAGL